MGDEQLTATVDIWARARWDAQPWLEERMGYTTEQNLSFFRDVVSVEYEVWTALEEERVVGLIALAEGEIDQRD